MSLSPSGIGFFASAHPPAQTTSAPTSALQLATSNDGGSSSGSSSGQPASQTANKLVYRIQIFPHREGFSSNPLAPQPQPASGGFNFSPIEKDLSPGTVIRIGRKVDRAPKDKKEDKDRGNGSGSARRGGNNNGNAAAQAANGTSSALSPGGSSAPININTGGVGGHNGPSSPPPVARSSSANRGGPQPGGASSASSSSSSLPRAARSSVGGGPDGTVISPLDMEHIMNSVQGIPTGPNEDASPYAVQQPQQQQAQQHQGQLAPPNGVVPDAGAPAGALAINVVGLRRNSNGTDQAAGSLGGALGGNGNGEGSSSSSAVMPGTPGRSGAAPKTDFIAFKSKVVSRTHAELWVGDDGQVMFRDVGSSSGTLLNRLRLSPSGRESRPYPIKSGDVIQLGLDYQGRQEEIYKCVQMKIFISIKSKERQKTNPVRLRTALKALLAAMNPGARDATDASCTDCCICLSSLSPQQALFLAPCSHCFHYRCVMPLLGSNVMFQCPLCRQVANLDSQVMDDQEDDFNSSDDAGHGPGGGGGDDEWQRSLMALDQGGPGNGGDNSGGGGGSTGGNGAASDSEGVFSDGEGARMYHAARDVIVASAGGSRPGSSASARRDNGAGGSSTASENVFGGSDDELPAAAGAAVKRGYLTPAGAPSGSSSPDLRSGSRTSSTGRSGGVGNVASSSRSPPARESSRTRSVASSEGNFEDEPRRVGNGGGAGSSAAASGGNFMSGMFDRAPSKRSTTPPSSGALLSPGGSNPPPPIVIPASSGKEPKRKSFLQGLASPASPTGNGNGVASAVSPTLGHAAPVAGPVGQLSTSPPGAGFQQHYAAGLGLSAGGADGVFGTSPKDRKKKMGGLFGTGRK
ncbi:hypothetical protein HK101_002919 [Irineochytrium annulatum]|nr:hypothetical protein HK101_002919 [Irineochytrium annulatum]